MIKKPVRKR